MKKFIAIIFIATSCSNPTSELASYYEPSSQFLKEIDLEVRSISNSNELTGYLERISELDQKYRIEENSILEDFGYDSKEHKNIWKKIHQTDAENYFRVGAILERYGYPKVDSVGKIAAKAPWIVIHHSPYYEHRVKHFKVIYLAYLEGDLEEDALGMLMDRMHVIKFNKTFQMSGPYDMSDRIDTLIEVLELEKQITGLK